MSVEIASAARKTSSSIAACRFGRRTESGWMAGSLQHEHRPEVVLPRRDDREHGDDSEDRFGHRQHDRPEQPERARAVRACRLEHLARKVVEESLHQHDVERARARRQPHRPERVDQRGADQRRVEDRQVERNEQHDRGHEQGRRARDRRSPCRTSAAGRSARSRRSSRRRSARPTIRQRPRSCSRTARRCARSTMRSRRSTSRRRAGRSPSGSLSVSCVGVIADFASQSSGPRPTMKRITSRTMCRVRFVQRIRRRRQSDGDRMPRSGLSCAALSLRLRRRSLRWAARDAGALDLVGHHVHDLRREVGRGGQFWLQDLVRRKYTSERTARNTASIRLSAVAAP